MIKLIVTDLDGSLLNDKKELPADFWDIENALIKQGITMGIASGRPHHNLVKLFAPIKDTAYFLSDNGSYVTYKNEELFVQLLNKLLVDDIVMLSRKIENVYPVLCGKHKAYMEDTNETLIKTALQYYQNYEIVDDLTRVDAPILKVSLCDMIDAETNCYPHFRDFEQRCKVAVAGQSWLDFTSLNADKGIAVQLLQERLGITFNETLVFGDYLNDLEMMRTARYSYAMKNAHPGIISAAAFVTDADNNNEGVIKTIRQLLLSEKNLRATTSGQ